MPRKILTAVLTLWATVLVPAMLTAQLPLPDGPPVDPALRFEVASIKPYNDTGPTRVRIQPSGLVDFTGASVRLLLRNAFRVQDDQVIGLLGWADTDRYSVLGKAPAGTPVTGMPTMLAKRVGGSFQPRGAQGDT